MSSACTHCQAPLPARALGNACPACLMAEAMGPEEPLPTGATDLTVPWTETPPHASQDSMEGTTLGVGGRYKILQRIGEGGFGTVFMAEQTAPVRRRVAVKILKAGMDTRQVVARFEAERQALAMMDHPNIARVLDGGETAQGRPFFVMELVRGTPITAFCDREKLDTRARLRLFIQVCRAVQHAHQKGIVHRDLKPGNVLVTVQEGAEPAPKVIDFGVAKALETSLTDKTLFTRFEQMVGTPAYMSPEQAGADAAATDIDTRADIYALGVLLYELLTGTTPFEANTLQRAAFDEVRRILREEEAPRPSVRLASLEAVRRDTVARDRLTESGPLGRQLRGDLDWIVMKAIEKDRRRRYETANGLAADVERFLHDDPVEARPPSAAYRFQKLARRHKRALGMAAAIAVLLLAGIAASTWQAVLATKEKNRANEAEAIATRRQEEAQAISNFLTGMFESAQPGEEGGGRNMTVAEAVRVAEKNMETDTEIPPERRTVLQQAIGSVYYSLGYYADAVRLQELALAFFKSTDGPEHQRTIGAMIFLAKCYDRAGRREEALALRESGLALCRKVHGPEHPNTIWAMNGLANSYSDDHAGRWREALALKEEVLALSRKVNGAEHRATLNAMHNLANSWHFTGRLEEAQAMRRETLELRRRVLGPEHPDTILSLHHLANSMSDLARPDEALKMYEESLTLSRKINGPDHSLTHAIMSDLAIHHQDRGRREEALTLKEEVLAVRRKVLGPDHPDTLIAMQNLSTSYSTAGRVDAALALDEEVLQKRRKLLGPEHRDTLMAMFNLGGRYAAIGRKDEALRLVEESVALCRKHLAPVDRDALAAEAGLAVLYNNSGRLEEALKMRENILALTRQARGPEHPDTLRATSHLLNSYRSVGRTAEGLKMREELLALMRKVLGPEHPDTILELYSQAIDFFNAGHRIESITLLTEVLAHRCKALGPDHPDTLNLKARLIHACLLADDMVRVFELAGTEPLRADSPSPLAALIKPNSNWRWLHPVDGVDPATADPDFHSTFFSPGFDDSGWSTGTDSEGPAGGFGYGDEGFTGVDIGTPGDKASGKTAYFRHRFTTGQEFTHLELRCRRDDGIIVYLDGREVIRNNVSHGPDAWDLPAHWAVFNIEETTVFRFPLKDFVLPAGEHVLAISLHNTKEPSSDLSIGAISLVQVAEEPAGAGP